MLYLIPSKSILKDYLSSHQLQEFLEIKELRTSLFRYEYYSKTPYNNDYLIKYSDFKKLEGRNPSRTRKNIEEEIKSRVKIYGKYKKKNIDIFILETSKEKFNSVGEKLSAIAKEVGAKFDYKTLSEENLTNLTDNFEEYYEEHLKDSSLTDIATNLTEKFFEIKNKYNEHKIANMNRLTTNGLSKFYKWFENGYVSYKHILSFSKNDLKLSARNADKKTLFNLFGYLPSDSDCFPESALKYINKLIKKSKLSIHKISMMIEYYKGHKIIDSEYKPPYEYFLVGTNRKIDRQFLIYFSLALGLSLEEIKTLFQKSNCLFTDFLREDLLLCYFAKNNYFIDVKQRGALFRYLLNYLYDYDVELFLKKVSQFC